MDEGTEVPKPINIGNQIFDIQFHPSTNILASACVDGTIRLHRYDKEENTELLSVRYQSQSVRSLQLSKDGNIYSASADGSLCSIDVNTGKLLVKKPAAHQEAINKIYMCNNDIMASGDDSGVVKLWDLRTGESVLRSHEHEDYVSDFVLGIDGKTLVSSRYVSAPCRTSSHGSGDGTIVTYDIRKHKSMYQSEEQDTDFLCMALIKDGKRIVLGTQEGVLDMITWGELGTISDKFPGHPESVDCMIPVDRHTILTGSSDGLIRVVQIQPNQLLGIIGQHEFPVEHMALDHEQRYLATTGHEGIVQFWDVFMLYHDDGPDEIGDGDGDGAIKTELRAMFAEQNDSDMMDDESSSKPSARNKKKRENRKKRKTEKNGQFFNDMQ